MRRICLSSRLNTSFNPGMRFDTFHSGRYFAAAHWIHLLKIHDGDAGSTGRHDMNRHVHSSRYLDYVLAARFDQMERCYKMSMQAFMARGLGWVIKTSHIEFIRPLQLGDHFSVTTCISKSLNAASMLSLK